MSSALRKESNHPKNRKVRLYEVKLKDGHDNARKTLLPAFSKTHLLRQVLGLKIDSTNNFELAIWMTDNVKYLGWAEVGILFSSETDYKFSLICKDHCVIIGSDDKGFSYLKSMYHHP